MVKKILAYFVFPVIIVVLGYLIVESIMTPVRFDKELARREAVAIQRLKDIRTLQVMYKTVNNRFTSSLDTLADFYNNGEIMVVRKIGSMDDSVAVAQNRVFRDSVKVAVRDTLFSGRNDFRIDSLKYIPFSGGEPMQMEAVIRTVSGVNVPLFEVRVPYDLLLKGLDHQLIVNLKAKQEAMQRYEGLMVGSISSPNNNAGNWE